jgi:nucleotide-binding universal stress UspA family protein
VASTWREDVAKYARLGTTESMNEIIVGYDGTEEADRALSRAADFAEALSAKLVVVSVTSPTATAPELAPVIPEPITIPAPAVPAPVTGLDTPGVLSEPQYGMANAELSERQLERARSALLGRSVNAEFVAEYGDTAERVLEVAKHRNAELIVVGSRQHGFLERLLGKPVEEEVARHAQRDVLLVH